MMKAFLKSMVAERCDCARCSGAVDSSLRRQNQPDWLSRYEGLDVPTYLRRKLSIPG